MTTRNYLSNANSTTTTLAGGATFTGPWEDVKEFPSVCFSAKADVAGTMYCDFSHDASTVDSTLTYAVAANINEVHRLTITRRYCRLRYVNGSSAQSSFNMTLLVGEHTQLAAPLNLSLGQDADAIAVRSIDSELDIAEGKRAGYFIVNKFGENSDIDSATTPEDVWEGGGTYTGFPTGSAELVTVVSTDTNDTNSSGTGARTVTIEGLDANYELQSETIALNGTSLVDSANTYTRVFRAYVVTSGSSNQAFNAGTITIAHKVTTANIFGIISAGRNQTRTGCYTIPAGHTGYLRRIECYANKATTATLDGVIWQRPFGASPRLIRPFSFTNTEFFTTLIYGGLPLTEKTDIAVRITTSSANNIDVITNFDIVVVKD